MCNKRKAARSKYRYTRRKKLLDDHNSSKEQAELDADSKKHDVNGKRYFARLDRIESFEIFENTFTSTPKLGSNQIPPERLKEIEITPTETPKVVEISYTFDVLEKDFKKNRRRNAAKTKGYHSYFLFRYPRRNVAKSTW